MNLRRNARGWLLWLALLLPIAQAMAGVHALSHIDDRQGEGIAHLVHCDLCLTAAKRGCNQGVCGACTVLVDGRTARACLTLSHNAAESEVQTLEGLRENPLMHELQAQFTAHGAFQCGFCTPGMLVSAYALLGKTPVPTEAEVRAAMSGNLCRCSGYQSIVSAVTAAGRAFSARKEQA